MNPLFFRFVLYGSESWCLMEDVLRLLKSFDNRCVRSMCGVSMSDVFEKRINTGIGSFLCFLAKILAKGI